MHSCDDDDNVNEGYNDVNEGDSDDDGGDCEEAGGATIYKAAASQHLGKILSRHIKIYRAPKCTQIFSMKYVIRSTWKKICAEKYALSQ